MARPFARPGTSNRQYRRRYPADIRRILNGLGGSFSRPSGWGTEGINLSLGTADTVKAKTAHARIAADVEAHFAVLRIGPRQLTHRETVALSGEVYRALVKEHEDDPGEVERWMRAEAKNFQAEHGHSGNGGQSGMAALRIPTDEERKHAAYDRLFGCKVDALLSSKALWV